MAATLTQMVLQYVRTKDRLTIVGMLWPTKRFERLIDLRIKLNSYDRYQQGVTRQADYLRYKERSENISLAVYFKRC